MRRLLSLLTVIAVALQLMAAPVDVSTAKTKAQQYLAQKVYAGKYMAPKATQATLIKTEMGDKAQTPVYYIFNTESTFVIVSGDDRAEEILAYGDRPLNLDRIPTNMQVWLDGYKRQLDWLLTHPEVKVDKTEYRSPALKATTYGPLLTCLWDQTEPYWDQCKFTYSGTTYQCYTGCPSTSASMVMYFWKYPTEPVGPLPAYTSTLELGSWNSVNFTYPALPQVTFDWDNMKDHYGTWVDENGTSHNETYTAEEGAAVATLMRYVGQAEHMMYGTAAAGGSGIYTSDAQIVADMYIGFGYDEATTRLVQKGNYSEAQWAQLLQTEMIEGRPVVFMAVDNGAGGHAFNVDGYDSNLNKYHINFGWSGDGNNWCAMNAFSDGEGYTFNSDQQMIIGIQPPMGMIKANPSEVNFQGFAGETYTQVVRVQARNIENNITIAKSGDNVYSVSHTTITPEQAANGVDVTVTYAPTAAGTTNATLTLSCADEEVEDVVVPITGVAQPRVPTLIVDPQALNFTASLSSDINKTISVTGAFLTNDINITLNDENGVFTVSPTTISKNSTNVNTPVTVTVTFNSPVEGNYTGSLTIASNGAESKTVTLTAKAHDGGTAADPFLDIAKYETIDEAGATVSGMSSIYKYTEYAEDDCAWLTVSNYGALKTDATQNWFTISGTEKTGSETWNATDVFLGSSSYFSGSAYYTDWNEDYQTFYVTNCTQVKQFANNRSNTTYPLKMEIYECTLNADGSITPSTTAVETKQNTTTSTEVLASSELDETKIYKVAIYNDYSKLYEIGFKTPISQLETPVATAATDVTASSFTANWNACAGADSYILQVMPKNYDILTEGFSKFTKTGAVEMSGSLDEYMDNAGWTGSKLYEAIGGIRLGTGSSTGTLTSPALDLSASEGKVTVAFKAKTFNNDVNCNLKISCGNNTQTVTLPDNNEASYNVVLDCNAAAGQKITFATTANGKRVIITSIHIMDGEHGTTSLKSIDIDGITITGITDNKYTVTDLDPNTTYIYDVKAVYGSKQSKWSNKINVTTLNEDVEPGITLAELLETGVDGEQYTISNDLAVADVADYLDYAFLTDGQDNWICVNAAEAELFAPFVNNGVIKGGTLKGVLSGMGLNPLFTANAEAQGADSEVDFTIEQMYLDDAFAPKVNQVIDVVGFWNANDGALRAYAPGGSQGPSLTLDYTWGAASNTLQNGLRYVVRCGINIKEPWHTAAGIAPRDYEYDFQNYIARAMRLPETPTGIGVIAIEDANTIVNVYTTQGQLIRQNVKVADATRNLPCGIYIVGNKKVVVK